MHHEVSGQQRVAEVVRREAKALAPAHRLTLPFHLLERHVHATPPKLAQGPIHTLALHQRAQVAGLTTGRAEKVQVRTAGIRIDLPLEAPDQPPAPRPKPLAMPGVA